MEPPSGDHADSSSRIDGVPSPKGLDFGDPAGRGPDTAPSGGEKRRVGGIAGDHADLILRGSVVDAVDGQAVAGAAVEAREITDQSRKLAAETDEEGRFQLSLKAGVLFDLFIEAEGYQTKIQKSRLAPEAGQNVVFALQPLLHVEGRVIDQFNNPVAEV